MSLHVLWSEWIAQPQEHVALYMAVAGYRRHMDAYDDGERARKRAEGDRANAAARGRR